MYNEEIKERFLIKNKNKRGFLEKFEESERELGLDICQMSIPQAIATVETMNSYDMNTFYTVLATLKAYAKWCYNEGLFQDAPYGILGISVDNLNPKEFIKRMIFPTEQDLISELSSVQLIHDGYVEVIACIFAWLGIPDPLAIHDSDVFIEGRKIMADGVVIVDGFSDYVAQFLDEYKRLRSSTRENASCLIPVIKDRSVDTFIKRFCSPNSAKMGKPMDIRVIQSAIYKLNCKYVENGGESRFNYRNILKSGSLSRLYSAECGGLDVFDKENEEVVKGFFYETNYRSITWLYKRYKEAFNL